MEMQTYGKTGQPAVLFLSGGAVTCEMLAAALHTLESSYQLLIPEFDAADTAQQRADAVSACLRRDFAGRIWGAYALRESGDVLLRLLGRGDVRIRTVIFDSCAGAALPDSLPRSAGRVWYWLGSKNSAAKKTCQALKAALPALHTLTLKKLRADDYFLLLRPDLMIKRLKKTFGAAKTVSLSTVMPAEKERLWRLLPQRRATRAERFLTEELPVVADGEHGDYITGGSGKLVKLWSHLTHLDALTPTQTACTDQVEMAAGPFSGCVSLWAKCYLRRQQRQWKRALRRKAGG